MRSQTYLLGALFCWIVGTGVVPSAPPDQLAWLDNYADALREAKRTQKPIFLEFRCEA